MLYLFNAKLITDSRGARKAGPSQVFWYFMDPCKSPEVAQKLNNLLEVIKKKAVKKHRWNKLTNKPVSFKTQIASALMNASKTKLKMSKQAVSSKLLKSSRTSSVDALCLKARGAKRASTEIKSDIIVDIKELEEME